MLAGGTDERQGTDHMLTLHGRSRDGFSFGFVTVSTLNTFAHSKVIADAGASGVPCDMVSGVVTAEDAVMRAQSYGSN